MATGGWAESRCWSIGCFWRACQWVDWLPWSGAMSLDPVRARQYTDLWWVIIHLITFHTLSINKSMCVTMCAIRLTTTYHNSPQSLWVMIQNVKRTLHIPFGQLAWWSNGADSARGDFRFETRFRGAPFCSFCHVLAVLVLQFAKVELNRNKLQDQKLRDIRPVN